MNSKSPNALQRYLARAPDRPGARSTCCATRGAFAWQTLKGFKANQGLLLAGAVAYYALLSIVPLLILTVIALSQADRPGASCWPRSAATSNGWCRARSTAVVRELANFLDKRQGVGWLLLGTMIFFSSLAFTVLENAMSVIFLHRVVEPEAPLHLLGADPVRLHPLRSASACCW